MEKRILGIILSLLGIAGLIYAGVSFLNGGEDTRNIKAIIFSGVLGGIFFVAGIGLIRNTKDKVHKKPAVKSGVVSTCYNTINNFITISQPFLLYCIR